jgi:hypothetical protein
MEITSMQPSFKKITINTSILAAGARFMPYGDGKHC